MRLKPALTDRLAEEAAVAEAEAAAEAAAAQREHILRVWGCRACWGSR